jgi:hypothetical protein
VYSTVVFLRNLVDGEVGDVNIGGEFRLKGSADDTQLIPGDATEEGVTLDRRRTIVGTPVFTESIICVAKEA